MKETKESYDENIDTVPSEMKDRLCMHCWVTQSTVYCGTCICFYCGTCVAMTHAKSTLHYITSIQNSTLVNANKSVNSSEFKNIKCKIHTNKDLAYCCTNCNYKLICETCIIMDSHESHFILTLPEAIPRVKKRLLECLSFLKSSAFILGQKITEVSALASQRKNTFQNNLLNVEDAKKALINAIIAEQDLLHAELKLLSDKVSLGGKNISKSCDDLHNLLIRVCGESSILLQISEDMPSHTLNRYVRISNIVKGTLDPTYKVLVPELQHLSVPYWNLNNLTVLEVLQDTQVYIQKHLNNAINISEAICTIASGDISVVDTIKLDYFKTSVKKGNQVKQVKLQDIRVHKIITNKIKENKNANLRSNPSKAVYNTNNIEKPPAKAKQKSNNILNKHPNDLVSFKEWLGIHNANKLKSLKNIQGLRITDKINNGSLSKNQISLQNGLKSNKELEITTVGRDEYLERNYSSRSDIPNTKEYFEAYVHLKGILMASCIKLSDKEQQDTTIQDCLKPITLKLCFPFILLYDYGNNNSQKLQDHNSSELDNEGKQSILLSHPKLNKKDLDSSLEEVVEYPSVIKEKETILINLKMGTVEKPVDALFITDIRHPGIRIHTIHEDSITKELSSYLSRKSTTLQPINEGFEVCEVSCGKTLYSWVFSCSTFKVAERWVSMLRGDNQELQDSIASIGIAKLLNQDTKNKVIHHKKESLDPIIDPSCKIQPLEVPSETISNNREKLLLLTRDMHSSDDVKNIPDLLSIRKERLNKLRTCKKHKNELNLDPKLRIGQSYVTNAEALLVRGLEGTRAFKKVVLLLAYPTLVIIPFLNFEAAISRSILQDEYVVSEHFCTLIIKLTNDNIIQNGTTFEKQLFYIGKIASQELLNKNSALEHLKCKGKIRGFEIMVPNKVLIFICPNSASEKMWIQAISHPKEQKIMRNWRQLTILESKGHSKNISADNKDTKSSKTRDNFESLEIQSHSYGPKLQSSDNKESKRKDSFFDEDIVQDVISKII
ncbi:uncharacterized protein CMU_021230 [Cryptosporidium muris RN66]|uniref:B box-type domain-containing protein n=1 Tax=Cryptosporidium muris (strain RN66) TaxID=441375 RepID=B6AJG9_CRYMR|nr:uncharacterized protein CMU_021230 [Cryptosporidium muris RN66]EEA08360.1 hypothetical protein, conserved [Cryptosporidium muris RN66]|eukprot:XP_002142709.1 hypothetical protein [Cryptosporidium muris RN66]